MAYMVDISKKESVYREAIAEGFIRLRKETVELIRRGAIEKGDVITVSKIAGILAAKKVSELLPLCHTIPLTHVDIDLKLLDDGIKITTVVRTNAQTGVEMEALTATSIALLNIWDMVKKYEKDEIGQYPETVITNIRVVRKYKSST